jgi:cyanophycinase
MAPVEFSRTRTRWTAWTLTVVFGSVLAFAAVREAHPVGLADHDDSKAPPSDARIPGGSLMLVGGGWVPPEVRRRFVELAGGVEARIVVIPATDPPAAEEERWLAPWRTLGARSVNFCNARDRETADDPAFCVPLTRATGVWFSGGHQEVLAERYVGTLVEQCLHDVLERNGVVGGCSAGAAVLSRVMIEEGEMKPVEARGLDLISNGVVDQHFLRRNRLWRLQQVLAAHPRLIGFGVDEQTALVIENRSWRLSVVGESYALVCLPARASLPARTEILKPGDVVLLSDLRKDHLAYQPSGKRPAPQQTGFRSAESRAARPL